MSSLKLQLEEAEKELSQLKNDNQKLSSAIMPYEEKLSSLQLQLEKTEREKSLLKDDNKKLSIKFEQLNSRSVDVQNTAELKELEKHLEELEIEKTELTEELNSYKFEYEELWSKLEGLKEENKVQLKDIEWLHGESSLKDKILAEKLDIINKLIKIVTKPNTSVLTADNNDTPTVRISQNQDEQSSESVDKFYSIHLIGDSIIKPIIPDILLPSNIKANINKTVCYTFEELAEVDSGFQSDIVLVHCGTNNLANSNDVERVTTLAQTSLVKLKEKLPESTQLIYSLVAPRGDEVDQKPNEFNAHMLLFCDRNDITICEHNNLLQRDGIIQKFFNNQDKVHLSEEGYRVFSANFSYFIRMVLKIPTIPKRSRTLPQRFGCGRRYRGRGTEALKNLKNLNVTI